MRNGRAKLFKLEKNVPIPPKNVATKYPFREMEVGDSFAIPKSMDVNNLRYAVSYFGKRNDRKYTVHKMPAGDGFRCWRVK